MGLGARPLPRAARLTGERARARAVADEPLGRLAFAQLAVEALNEYRGATAPPLMPALLNGVTTSNAGQAARRPLASGLTLDKTFSVIPGWRPLSVKESIKHWIATPRGKPLGE